MTCDPEPPEAQALWRAAERGGIAARLFEPDRRLEGYAWYDAIARIATIHIEVTADGRTRALDVLRPGRRHPQAQSKPVQQRPDAIRIGLTVTPHEGPRRILDLDADLAFAGEAWSWAGDALPLVTPDSDLEPWQLAQLMRAGFFSASDDTDADSWETQRNAFETEALHTATKLLVSDDQARITSIADAVTRDLFWLIPHDRGAEISVRDRKVTVTLGEPAARGRRRRLTPAPGRRVADTPSTTTASPRPPGARPASRPDERGAGARERPVLSASRPPLTGGPTDEDFTPIPARHPPASPPRRPACADEAKKRAIAQALWTEIHWLMPTDRAVTITVDGDDIGVAFGPPRPGGCPASH